MTRLYNLRLWVADPPLLGWCKRFGLVYESQLVQTCAVMISNESVHFRMHVHSPSNFKIVEEPARLPVLGQHLLEQKILKSYHTIWNFLQSQTDLTSISPLPLSLALIKCSNYYALDSS